MHTIRRGIGRSGTLGMIMIAAFAAAPALGQYQQPTSPSRPATPATPNPAPSTPTPTTTKPAPAKSPVPATPNPPDSIVDKVIKWKNITPWTLNVEVQVKPQPLYDNNRKPVNEAMTIETAAVVFPLPPKSAGHQCLDADMTAELLFDNRSVDSAPKINDGYPAGTRLLRLEMRNQDGRTMLMKVTIKMRCAETVFDEKLAMTVPWPSDWPEEAASCLRPQWFLDYRYDPQEKAACDKLLEELLQQWLNKQDPAKMPPAKLAKILMGKVQETVNPSGEGMRFNHNSSFQGVDMQLPFETLRLIDTPNRKKTPPRGTDIDVAQALTAMCRVAGLPARTVIGWDMADSQMGNNYLDRIYNREGKLRAWTEFALVDPPTKKVVWVPMDPVRQRKTSTRPKALDKPWEYFGTNEDLDYVLPIAYQIAPPTTVAFHGSPAFWGWLVTPQYPVADQAVRFIAYQTASRGEKKPTK